MNQLVQFWLATQCKLIPGTRKGLVLLGAAGKGPYKISACLPEGFPSETELLGISNQALAEKKYIIQGRKKINSATGEPLDHIACPLFFGDELQGVVAIEMSSHPEKQQQDCIQQLKDGAIWLEALMQHQEKCGQSQLVSVVELMALCLERTDFQEAVTAVVSELATRYSCEQVSAGFITGRNVRVAAISNSAQINYRAPLVTHIADALQETIDQGEVVQYPSPGENSLHITRAHARLTSEHGCGNLCTIPFAVNGVPVGAFLFEQQAEKPFDPNTVELCRQVVMLVGPVLEMRRREDRLLIKKTGDSVYQLLQRIFGAGSFTWKLILAAMVGTLVFLSLFTTEYRVVAHATLEPKMQRAVVASQTGYIGESVVRAGDLVQSGDVLARLEDKDLKLEKQHSLSQLDELGKEYSDALARHDRTRTSIIKAKIAQTEARLHLVSEQLSRTRLTAPFDGLVVRGDLSRSLGSPVERGQVLFEIAPVDVYHVVLEVDERNIKEIVKGKHGTLVLSGMVDERLDFVVTKITPVSATKEGRNFFRVEAELKKTSAFLRPGMTGVAKISIDRRKLLWIWTHQLIDWLRIHTWRFLP